MMNNKKKISIAVGAGTGMIFGAALGNIGVGLVIGAAIGLILTKVIKK